MTDPQLMTLALAIIIPLSLLIYSNSRITEPKETLRAEMATGNDRISDLKETLRAEMAAGFARISSDLQSLKADLKIHELKHHHK